MGLKKGGGKYPVHLGEKLLAGKKFYGKRKNTEKKLKY